MATQPIAPAALPPLPDPPSLSDPVNFDARADAFVDAQQDLVPLLNVELGKAHQNAVSAVEHAGLAQGSAGAAGGSAGAAAGSAAAAAASAASAVNAPGTSGTSATALTIAVGSKTLATQGGKAWAVGQPVAIARTAAPTTAAMYGRIAAYNADTGAMTVDVDRVLGAGTFSDWTIALTGVPGLDSAQAGTAPDQAPRNRDLGSGAYIDQTFLHFEAAGPSQLGVNGTGGSAGTLVRTVQTFAAPGAEPGDEVTVRSSTGFAGMTYNNGSAVTASDSQRPMAIATVTSLGVVTVNFLYFIAFGGSNSASYVADPHALYIRVSKRVPE